MPNYLTPGVYVEEVPSSQAPIEGVGTSVAAFIGRAPYGPVNDPQRIASWADFAAIFADPADPERGPFMEGSYLAHAVYGFFENGGQLCWIVRVGAETPAEPPRAALGQPNGSGNLLQAASIAPSAGGPITITVHE